MKYIDKNFQLGYDYESLPRHQATHCANFVECPLCFKCRNFNDSVKCDFCTVPRCNKARHTEKMIEKMLLRPRAVIKRKVD